MLPWIFAIVYVQILSECQYWYLRMWYHQEQEFYTCKHVPINIFLLIPGLNLNTCTTLVLPSLHQTHAHIGPPTLLMCMTNCSIHVFQVLSLATLPIGRLVVKFIGDNHAVRLPILHPPIFVFQLWKSMSVYVYIFNFFNPNSFFFFDWALEGDQHVRQT